MDLFSRDLKAVEFPKGAEWLNVDRPLSLEDLKGKIVLLDFWTYCCINCMHVIPDLRMLEEEYPELVVIGVHSAKFTNEQVRDNIRHAILRYEIEHPVIVDNEFHLWQRYVINAWPSFVLIDPVGNVAAKASGEGPYAMFAETIASLSQAFDEQGLLNKEPFSMDLVADREPGAALSYPGKLEVDRVGRRLFLTDSNHNRIVVFRPDGEVIQVIGSGTAGARDGPVDDSEFFRPQGLAYDPRDDVLFVADTENHLVRRVDLAAGEVTTVLGMGRQGGHSTKGRGTDLAINSPWDLTLMGDHLYIAMAGPHQIWRLDLRTLEAERYAGSGREDIVDGPRERAALAQPSGIDNDGKRIFFADSEVSAVRMVEDDQVKTLVGAGLFDFDDIDGPLDRARFQHPLGVFHDSGNLFVADTYNHKVKMIDLEAGTVSTLAGSGRSDHEDGSSRKASLSEPNDLLLFEGNLWIVDTNNHAIRLLEPGADRLFTFKFTNEEALWPKPTGGLKGREVVLAPVRIASERATVRFALEPPKGYVWNTGAPNYLEVVGSETIDLGDHEIAEWDWRYDIPVEAKEEGDTVIRFRVIAYYCEKDYQDFCRFAALDLVLPVTVTESGPLFVDAEYKLKIE